VIVTPNFWFTLILPPPRSTKQASLINDFAQEILQILPRFLETECYLLGTYIISLINFDSIVYPNGRCILPKAIINSGTRARIW